MAAKLTGEARKTALATIPGWTELMELWQKLKVFAVPDCDERLARKLKGGLADGWTRGQRRQLLELLPGKWLRCEVLLREKD